MKDLNNNETKQIMCTYFSTITMAGRDFSNNGLVMIWLEI